MTERVDGGHGLGTVVVLDLPFESYSKGEEQHQQQHGPYQQQPSSSSQPQSPLCASSSSSSSASTTTSLTEEDPSLQTTTTTTATSLGYDLNVHQALESLTRILSSEIVTSGSSGQQPPPPKRHRVIGNASSMNGSNGLPCPSPPPALQPGMGGQLAFPVLTGSSEPHITWNPPSASAASVCYDGLIEQSVATPPTGPALNNVSDTQTGCLGALLEELARPLRSPAVENVHNMVSVNSTRKKDYSAPPGVWKNSGGYISTVYINKRRVYGPLRQTLEESVRDREQMLLAKERGASEDEIRDLVITMKRLHPSPSPVRRPNSKRARSASTTATAAAKAVAEYGVDGLVASYEMDGRAHPPMSAAECLIPFALQR
ncbi:hypothetical protein FOZ63_019827 [Perkinsus olseni]|uniref:Uncharacterized protein n=1 Tax=Perkinsus olseni TaxID=32597 RepID=A0A7J6Q108_PEROL|nr:hypothetical protein FOZ63_019827 [Perkinsus olseni]